MKKELPKLFKKNVSKEHLNNTKVYYSNTNDNKLKESFKKESNNKISVEEKIKKLFKSSKYVFNINVIIKTAKKDYDTKIIGRIKNSLITNENDEIPIVEIEDIIIKDR